MPKHRRKSPNCPNCGFIFESADNFCPQCGQENHERIKSLPDFFSDLFQDLIQVDNQLYRSVKPFLFNPGFLTNAYIEGKRKYYVNPIRLYLVCSVLYFFVMALEIRKNTEIDKQVKTNKELLQSMEESSSSTIDSIARIALQEELAKATSKADSLRIIQKFKQLQDTLINHYQNEAISEDSLLGMEMKVENDENDISIAGFDFKQINAIAEKVNYDEDKILDSLQVEKTFWNRLLVRQSIRLATSTPRELVNNLLEQVPIMMFILLPIFAFFLNILYIRRKKFYVEHFIFTLHIHSFYFFIFTLSLLYLDIIQYSDDISPFVVLFTLLVVLIYSFIAFKKVYKQHWLKTFIKMNILGFFYGFTLFFVFIFWLLLSLALF